MSQNELFIFICARVIQWAGISNLLCIWEEVYKFMLELVDIQYINLISHIHIFYFHF